MENCKKNHKIFLTFFVIGFVVWFGGTLVRTTIAFELFDTGTPIELKSKYTNSERMNTVYIFTVTAPTVIISYIVATVSAVILTVLWRKELKQKDWLFMIFCLFIITIPIQFKFIYYDYVHCIF